MSNNKLPLQSDVGFSTSGNVTTGNVLTDNYLYANGQPFIGGNYGNANVVANLAALGTNPVSTTGNVTAGYFIGNGSQLTGLPAGYTDANVSTYLASGNNSAGFTTTGDIGAAEGTYSGNVAIAGNLTVSGNLNYQDVTNLSVGDPLIYIGANNTANVVDLGMVVSYDDGLYQHGGWVRDASDGTWKLFGNVVDEPTTTVNFANAIYQPMLAGAISSTGNVTGAYILGDGSQLTNLPTTTPTAIVNGTSNITIASANSTITFGVNGYKYGVLGSGFNDGSVIFGKLAGNANAASVVSIGFNAGQTAANNTVALGAGAGSDSAESTVSVGMNAGRTAQAFGAVAVGAVSGYTNQGANAVSIGYQAGDSYQAANSIAIGAGSGAIFQLSNAVSIGYNAAWANQSIGAIAIGASSGGNLQGSYSIAIGSRAGNNTQGNTSVAIGADAAFNSQGLEAIAIGSGAAAQTQAVRAVAIGNAAGYYLQKTGAIAIGNAAGGYQQGINTVAIGNMAGNMYQGNNAVAIGYLAGNNYQSANSVVINGSGLELNSTVSGFFAAPVRNDTGNVTNVVYYNTTTKEITYGPASGGSSYGNANVAAYLASGTVSTDIKTTGQVSATGNVTGNVLGGATVLAVGDGVYAVGVVSATGNVTGSYFIGNGSQLTGITSYSNAAVSAYLASGTNSAGYSTTGNVVANNFITAGNVGTGNISGANYISGINLVASNLITAGATITTLPNTIASFGANVDSYAQINIQNISGGANAEADLVLTSNNGNDTTNYVNIGIVNSAYDNATPSNSLGNIIFPADSYVYAQGNTANTAQSGGNLAIGTTVAGKTVKIFAGGATASNVVATVSNTGVTVAGNVSSNNFVGTLPNVNVVAGSYTTVFDNTGNVTFPTGTAKASAISASGNITGNYLFGNISQATGLGNVSTINLNGNGSTYLAGNGTWAAVSGGGGSSTALTRHVVSGNVTLALSDAGGYVYSSTSSALNITIPSVTDVAFPIGTVITVVLLGTGSLQLTPAATVDLYLAGNASPGNRTVSPYGTATLLMAASNAWIVNGTGVA